MADILNEHLGYLIDRVKLERYEAAIEQIVRPENSVLDLGCGSGILGLMALRAGAENVIFVEESAVIEIARQTIANAGFSDKAEFIQMNSFQVSLAERVDIVVCDHVGYFGFDYGLLELLADARRRFLKPDGVIVPAQLELKLAPVESMEGRKFVAQWRDGSIPDDFSWVRSTAANTKHSLHLNSDDVLADPASLATLEMGAEADSFYLWNAEFKVARDGMLDGLAGWFECQLYDDIKMSNSPTAEDRLNRPQTFLALESPIAVSAGEPVRATIMVRPLDQVIAWTIELPQQEIKVAHSTFNGLLLDRKALTRAQPDRLATVNERGRARQLILSYCDGERTVAEVQALVQQEHPQLFPSQTAMASFITEILAWDTSE